MSLPPAPDQEEAYLWSLAARSLLRHGDLDAAHRALAIARSHQTPPDLLTVWATGNQPSLPPLFLAVA